MTESNPQRFEGNASQETRKPHHVRKLNFGQSILTLDAVQQVQRQKDGVLIIDRNVTRIPCTERVEFVRKWIETQNASASESNDSSQSSPILSSYTTRHTEKSPVFGTRRKRTRRKDSLKNNATGNTVRARSSGTRKQSERVLIGISSENKEHGYSSVINKKENVARNLFKSESDMIPFNITDPNVSPVLDRNVHLYKRKCKKLEGEKLERKALNRIENRVATTNLSPSFTRAVTQAANISPILDRNIYSYKRKRRRSKENDCVDTNMNTVILCNVDSADRLDARCKLMCTQTRDTLLRKLESNLRNDKLESANKESKILEDSISSDSPMSEAKLNIEDSPKDAKDIAKMEIESSNEDSNDRKDTVDINSDTDKEVSDHIEDVDTQDVIPIEQNCNLNLKQNVLFLATKSSSVCSNNDSDVTYFSNAEGLRCTTSAEHLSQKISQISSQVNNITNNKSSQSEVFISMETSPQRTNPEPFMQLSLLDSGKKRKKPKRGSLSEKLQSAINRQISFLRMWRHQHKQTAKEGGSTPCVTVYVQTCVSHFGRQFLEGIVTEDPFELLPRKKESNFRIIKIMTIPEIMGQVEMGSKNIVQIFSPWEILDDRELILNVTYIKVVSNAEKVDVEAVKESIEHIKRLTVKDFDCSCINTGKMLSFCQNRLSKPDVMEKLFYSCE